jgi:hypothetical protein
MATIIAVIIGNPVAATATAARTVGVDAANAHAAGAGVADSVANHAAVAATVVEFKAIPADVFDGAVLDYAAVRAAEIQGAGYVVGGLG